MELGNKDCHPQGTGAKSILKLYHMSKTNSPHDTPVEILITEQQKGPETALQEDLKDKRLRPILVMAAH